MIATTVEKEISHKRVTELSRWVSACFHAGLLCNDLYFMGSKVHALETTVSNGQLFLQDELDWYFNFLIVLTEGELHELLKETRELVAIALSEIAVEVHLVEQEAIEDVWGMFDKLYSYT